METYSTRLLILASFLAVMLSAFLNPLMAQRTYLNNRLLLERISNNVDMLSGTTGMLGGLPQPPPGVVGDAFLKSYFCNGALLLFEGDQVVGGYAIKYDIQKDDFYLKKDRVIRVLEGSKVKNLVLVDSLSNAQLQFINGSLLKDVTGAPFIGFFEVLQDGNPALLRRTEIEVKAPDFHPALNVGSKDHRVVKHTRLYAAREGVAQEVPAGKKIVQLFPGKEDAISEFIKVNKLNVKSEYHLKTIFKQYETLVSGK